MSEHELPPVHFTRDELTYLQDMLNRERASWFNYYEELAGGGPRPQGSTSTQTLRDDPTLRDKVYHMNGRDTLAPGNHEQRWWDQKHGYE